MNVFELFATLGLDSTSYDEGLSSAEEKGSSFGKSLSTVVAGGAKVGMAALAATTTAVAGAGAAFGSAIADTAAYGDAIQKNSQKMGISIESYQEWQAVMQHSGTSMETLKASMKTLANAVETGNDAFERLGLTQEDLAQMNQEEIFSATITSLQNVTDTTERTYLAGQLLGRGATELGALLNASAEDTEAMKQRVHELGGVLSDDAVNAAAGFQDSLQDLQTSFSGLKNNLMSDFLPSISTVMDGLTEIMIGNDTEGLAKVDEGVNNFIDQMTTAMPRILEVGGRIIGSLMTAITNNLPELAKQAGPLIQTLTTGIITALPSLLDSAILIIGEIGQALMDNAPLLMDTALSLILKLADTFTKNAPKLIPAITSLITTLIRTLTEPSTLSLLISAALQLILALAEGIVAATPDLIAVIPELIANLIATLVQEAPEITMTVLELLGLLAMSVFQSIAGLMGTSLEEVGEGLGLLFKGLAEWGANVIQWLSGIGTSITTGVSNFFTGAVEFFTNGFNSMKEKASNGLNAVKDTFFNIFETVKNTVKNAVEFLKGLFKFDWKLPEIKLPHFTITGEFNLDPMNFQMPKIGIEWYRKAMAQPYLLDDASIFGAAGGKLLAGGESGKEIVYGHAQLMSDIGQAIDSRLKNLQFVVPVYIGANKIDQQIKTANARNAVSSGGR